MCCGPQPPCFAQFSAQIGSIGVRKNTCCSTLPQNRDLHVLHLHSHLHFTPMYLAGPGTVRNSNFPRADVLNSCKHPEFYCLHLPRAAQSPAMRQSVRTFFFVRNARFHAFRPFCVIYAVREFESASRSTRLEKSSCLNQAE